MALLLGFAAEIADSAVPPADPGVFGSSAMEPRDTADFVCPKLLYDNLFSLLVDVGLSDPMLPSEESTLVLLED